MKSAEIREAFLKYFAEQGHEIVASSALVPANDATLLFTNAGMVQFKEVFLGTEKRNYSRAASSQRCVRAGGKHNDLENVGYTARHHTFFEMLGNFSFGDYFKREAIQYGWKFLTKVLQLPPEKLWVTVHISDDEAADIWLNEVGVSAERFSRLDEDNFWQMGDTGPCGPSTEIFYDHGEEIPGGPPGSEGDDLDRYIEIWNLVFMQYERQADGSLQPLPKPSVDTGMGLERIAAVMQNVHSNYDIDLFQNLLRAAATVTECDNIENNSLKVIADHIRSCAFLIVDGVLPSNEGRGYVLRRIIRRAVRHGHKLGQQQPFFHKLVAALAEEMGGAYPELRESQVQVTKVLLGEEEQFAQTLDKGMAILNERFETLTGSVVPGDIIFTLYDTYGFPVDLTNDIARELNLTLDLEGYEQLMEAQRERARAASTFSVDYTDNLQVAGTTTFSGYEQLRDEGQILALICQGQVAESLSEGGEGVVVLNKTPFYAESGGQVGDTGYLEADGARFEVRDCQKQGDNYFHIGVLLAGDIQLGQSLKASVNSDLRAATAKNHSATHLLHAALRKVLGSHVIQKGSLVDSERLRFDFSHFEAVSSEQIREIEVIVNQQILANTPVTTELCDMETAQKKGAMALFGEKYGEEVRVLCMGEEGFSVELCGGTHVSRTGDIGLLRVISESGIAAGVRRIEAVTGTKAHEFIDRAIDALDEMAILVKATPEKLSEKLAQLVARNRQLEKDMVALKAQLASSSASDWLVEAKELAGIKVLVKSLQGADPKSMRAMIDQLKNKLGRSVVVLAGIDTDKVSLIAGVSSDLVEKIKAGDLIRHIATQIDGKGGGRADMAQGGGPNVEALPQALASVESWISQFT